MCLFKHSSNFINSLKFDANAGWFLTSRGRPYVPRSEVLGVTDSVVNKQEFLSNRTIFQSSVGFFWIHRWSKRSRLLATWSTTEPPDRAASQQKFTSMPSESCFMCVLQATEAGERRKAFKKKSAKCNSAVCTGQKDEKRDDSEVESKSKSVNFSHRLIKSCPSEQSHDSKVNIQVLALSV